LPPYSGGQLRRSSRLKQLDRPGLVELLALLRVISNPARPSGGQVSSSHALISLRNASASGG